MTSTDCPIPQHLITQWNRDLEEDVPRRSNLHARAKALLLLWEDPSHSRKKDAESLETLFNHRYRIEAECFYIPLKDSQYALDCRIAQLIESTNSSSSLAFVFYSGNGTVRQHRPYWLPDSKLQPEIDWFSLQERLEASSCDSVIILDCTYRARAPQNGQLSESSSYLRSVTREPVGRLEILAAPTSLNADNATFRNALMMSLAEASGEPVSMDQLRRRIYRKLGHKLDPLYVRPSRTTSIAILPSMKVDLDIAIDESINSGNQQGLKTWADRAPRQIKTFKFLIPEVKSGDGYGKSVSVQVDVASLSDLSEKNVSSWMKLAPPYVVDINIQGAVLSTKQKTKPELLDEVIEVWNSRSRLRRDLTTRDGHYKGIVILPMKWLDDGFNDTSIIENELRELSDVFRHGFDNCEIKPIYKIRAAGGPLQTVTQEIFEVLKGLTSSHLLIVVYNGHGKTSGQSGQCLLSGRHAYDEINWSFVQPHLEEAPCDVAQVLDCCFAGNAIKTKPQGRNEILAACEHNVTTPAGPDSYIKRFTSVLKLFVESERTFSLLNVHEKLKADAEQRNSSVGLTPPVHKLIPDSSDSITLRPKSLPFDRDSPDVLTNESQHEGNGFLGWAYAKIPICKGDDRRDWKDAGFAKILNGNEMLKELQNGA